MLDNTQSDTARYIRPRARNSATLFLQSSTAINGAGMATFVISHSDELANLKVILYKGSFRNDSFHSGIAVSLTRQSCGLAYHQHLILSLTLRPIGLIIILP